jgi:hypothetical protein
VDERRPSDLARAQASYFGDVEFKVARVVARLTGARVVLQDDGSQDAMPDLRIEGQSGVVTCGEIWVDTDAADAQTMSELFRRQHRLPAELPAPELRRVWQVSVSKATRLKPAKKLRALTPEQPSIERHLQPLLVEMELAGETFPVVATREDLVALDSLRANRLLDLGIVGVASRPTRPGEQGLVRLTPGPSVRPRELSWLQVTDWIGTSLVDPLLESHLTKLAATGLSERHFMMGVTTSSPLEIYWGLTDLPGVPCEAPRLPSSVTHLWLFDASRLRRVLVWLPDRGWLDAVEHWATD